MNYADAQTFLASLVNYERDMPRRYDTRVFDLENFAGLLARLGSPQEAFPVVHVVGTKGKGSAVAIMAAAFAAAGYAAGTFTSPHLRSVRERVAVGDEMISREDFGRLVGDVKAAMTGGEAANFRTYFETLLATALLYFRERRVDVAIIEAGLGGRLDATNVVKPAAVALTTLDLDHTQILGDTVEKIAAEKAGVFKAGVPVASAPQEEAAAGVVRDVARGVGASISFVGEDVYFSPNGDGTFDYRGPRYELAAVKVAMAGAAQRVNAAVALAALETLDEAGAVRVGAEAARLGAERGRARARAEIITGSPAVILDVAHTAASARELAGVMDGLPADKTVLVWGMSAEKDAAAFARELASRVDLAVATAAATPRAKSPRELLEETRGIFPAAEAVAPSAAAFARARAAAAERGLVAVAGSFYLAGEILTILEGPLD
jgi:dihydrofolate synthase/folylpolyglutamate synthase